MTSSGWWEGRASDLAHSVRRAVGYSGTSVPKIREAWPGVLAVLEDPARLEELARDNEGVRDNLGEGREATTRRVTAVHLLRREIGGAA